jgi:hypothetical protein
MRPVQGALVAGVWLRAFAEVFITLFQEVFGLLTRPEEIAHWSTLVEGMQESTQKFYQVLEGAIARRAIPGAEMRRETRKEAGFFSPKREYLLVKRGDDEFHICAAPFGTGFFVSWWLTIKLGFFDTVDTKLAPRQWWTFYQRDNLIMFQTAVHASVQEVLAEFIEAKGLKPLSEAERKPVMREFYETPRR